MISCRLKIAAIFFALSMLIYLNNIEIDKIVMYNYYNFLAIYYSY